MSVSDIWIHCFSHCGFLFVCLLLKSSSLCQQKPTQLSPSRASISKRDPCECPQSSCRPSASARGCTVLVLQAGGRLPKESPSTALPGVSHIHAKVLILPEPHWASRWVCEPSLAQGSSRCTPHPAPVSTGRTQPSWAASAMAGLDAEGQWPAALGTPSCRPPSPRHGWLHTSPSKGANWDLRCSHLPWQLSPPLPVWAQIPWKGQARTRRNCREQFTNPQAPVPSCVRLPGLLGYVLAHLMERNGPLQCSPDLLCASAVLSEAQGTTSEQRLQSFLYSFTSPGL